MLPFCYLKLRKKNQKQIRVVNPKPSDSVHQSVDISKKFDQRIDKLLQKLEQRAVHAPGLYPIKRSGDFLSIVIHGLEKHLERDLGENFRAMTVSDKQLVADWLEDLWRRPEGAIQLNAQYLIDKGKGFTNNTLSFPQEMTG